MSLNPALANGHGEDTVEPSVPAREFNLKAYAAITVHNDPASLRLEARTQTHRSPWPGSAYRDATNSATGACIAEYLRNGEKN